MSEFVWLWSNPNKKFNCR